VIAKDFGNLAHGYCLTSYSSQSKGVDCVFVAESSESFRAADREQFYVSASRFKESLAIYTDDKRELLNAVRKSSHRPSAMDLIEREVADAPKVAIKPEPVQKIESEISEKRERRQRQNVRQPQSRGIGI
jgi:ATP-dependent exoDNAse (exonuclease V) alpha subunit